MDAQAERREVTMSPLLVAILFALVCVAAFLLGLRFFRMAEPPGGATVEQVRRFGRLMMIGFDRDADLPRRDHHPRRPAARRRAGAQMKRAITLRRVGKTAAAIVLGLIVLDLAATAVTLALGVRMIQR